MSSKRRIESSRRNGARSRGPKTEAGKSRSSQNATRHALLAKRVVLENEGEENFLILLQQYVDKFQPRDGVEFGMVEEMAASYWRLHRGLAIEKNLFDESLQKNPSGRQISRLGQAWVEIANAPTLQNLLRYQSMLHRMHWRAMKNLLLLRDLEPENPELPNEPSPGIGHSETPPPDAPDHPAEQPAPPPAPPSAAAVPPETAAGLKPLDSPQPEDSSLVFRTISTVCRFLRHFTHWGQKPDMTRGIHLMARA